MLNRLQRKFPTKHLWIYAIRKHNPPQALRIPDGQKGREMMCENQIGSLIFRQENEGGKIKRKTPGQKLYDV